MQVRAGWWKFFGALFAVALVVSGCGGDDDTEMSADGSDSTTTLVDTDTDTSDADTDADDSASDDSGDVDEDTAADGDDDGDAGSDVNAQSQVALDGARTRWAAQNGTSYVWEYTEDGEGVRTAFCYEGVAGGDAVDDRGCPLAGTEPGESVDSYLDRIQEMLDFAAETPGREVYAEFDPTTGIPVQVEAFGGEVDGLLFLTERFAA